MAAANSINESTTGICGFTGTAFTGTAVTNHAVIIGGATSSTLSNVGPTATVGQVLQSAGASADPAFSTATYPLTTTINQILFSSSANTVTGLTTANNGLLITSATGVPSILPDGTTGQVLTATTGAPPSWASPATSGTVTSVSVVTANGFAGTVATATTTPAITLTTSQTGVLAGNGTSITGTAITQHDLLIGGASNAITSVAPSSTSGVPVISQGSSADPTFGTAVVAGGGTGNTTATAYAVQCGGTTSTGAHQSIASVGTSGQVLTSNGAGALPTFQAVGGGSSASWTPTIVGSSTAGTASYSTQVGRYQQIGSLVVATFDIVWTGGNGSGNLLVGGIPVAPVNIAGLRSVGYIVFDTPNPNSGASAGCGVIGAGDLNTTQFLLQGYSNVSGIAYNMAYAASGTMRGTAIYWAS
jgi:hypothetical protein